MEGASVLTANYDDVIPLTVHVVQDDTKEKRPKECRTSHRTIVLVLANPYAQIAGYDPARVNVYVNVMDNPVVISGDISQASDLANTTGTLATPNGRLMQVGNDYVIPGQDEMWVSSATYPTRIGLTIEREV